MAKQELIDLYKKLMEESLNFDYVNHFEPFAKSFFAEAIANGATAEEAKEGMLQSILDSTPSVPINAVNDAFENGLKGYHRPDENRLKELRTLREKAAKALVDYQYAYATNEKLQQVEDRVAKVVMLNNPDLNPVAVNHAVKENNDDYVKIVKATHEKVFTEENLLFLLKPRSAEEFIQDYAKLANLAGYIAECDKLNKVLENHVSPEEFEKYSTLTKNNMGTLLTFRRYMGTKADPIGAGVDFEQLETLPLSALLDANAPDVPAPDGKQSLSEWMMSEEGSELSRKNVLNYITIAIQDRGEKLNDALKNKCGANYDGEYSLHTMDDKELDAAHALALAEEKGETFFYLQKIDDPSDKVPIMLTDKTKMEFSVAEDVPMPKRMVKPQAPDAVPKPKKLGFFARLFNSIKEFFTGKPTKAASEHRLLESQYAEYCEKKETYDEALKEYNKMEKVCDMIETAQKAAAEKNKAAKKGSEGVQAVPKGKTFAMEKLRAACKSLSENRGSNKDIASDVLDMLTSEVLINAENHAKEEAFGPIKDKIRKSDGFKKLMDNRENLTKAFLETYQPGNDGSILKVAGVMGEMYKKASEKFVASQNEAPQKAERMKLEHESAKQLH